MVSLKQFHVFKHKIKYNETGLSKVKVSLKKRYIYKGLSQMKGMAEWLFVHSLFCVRVAHLFAVRIFPRVPDHLSYLCLVIFFSGYSVTYENPTFRKKI